LAGPARPHPAGVGGGRDRAVAVPGGPRRPAVAVSSACCSGYVQSARRSRRACRARGAPPAPGDDAGPASEEGDLMTVSQPARMTDAEFRALYDQLRRQVRWGADDRRGALNQIAAPQIQAAAGEVKLGRTVSLAAPIENKVSAD